MQKAWSVDPNEFFVHLVANLDCWDHDQGALPYALGVDWDAERRHEHDAALSTSDAYFQQERLALVGLPVVAHDRSSSPL